MKKKLGATGIYVVSQPFLSFSACPRKMAMQMNSASFFHSSTVICEGEDAQLSQVEMQVLFSRLKCMRHTPEKNEQDSSSHIT